MIGAGKFCHPHKNSNNPEQFQKKFQKTPNNSKNGLEIILIVSRKFFPENESGGTHGTNQRSTATGIFHDQAGR